MILQSPSALAFDSVRRWLWIADTGNHRIVAVDLAGELRFASKTGLFEEPRGVLAIDEAVLIADAKAGRVFRLSLPSGELETLAGSGKTELTFSPNSAPALETAMPGACALARDPQTSDRVLISLPRARQIWRLDLQRSKLSLFAGSGELGQQDGEYPMHSFERPSAIQTQGKRVYVFDAGTFRVIESGRLRTWIERLRGESFWREPAGFCVESRGAILIADPGTHRILRLDPSTRDPQPWVGSEKSGERDGLYQEALFNAPSAIIKAAGRYYVADTGNHRIRCLAPDGRRVFTLV